MSHNEHFKIIEVISNYRRVAEGAGGKSFKEASEEILGNLSLKESHFLFAIRRNPAASRLRSSPNKNHYHKIFFMNLNTN